MSADPRVAAALSHWGPRFVANGVPLTDFQEVTAAIARWEDWCAAWCARAAVHEALGEEALAGGFHLSAGEHLTTAAVCYHFAKFLFVHDREQMRRAHMKAVDCRTRALPHLRPPGERVTIPFAGGVLAGNLRRPDRSGRAPVVVMAMGLDSAKEEMESYEAGFLARGLATLAFDGPGQGEGEYGDVLRGDYEVPVAAVIDFVSRRADLDPDRIAVWGVSLGGYFAPRAAAHLPEIAACVALSGPYDWAACWDGLPALTREAFRVRAGAETEEEALRAAAAFTLDGAASRIRCPLFVVAGKRDRIVPWRDAERLAREAAGPVELLLVDDGNHVVNNRAYRYRQRTADWLAEVLDA